jgi:hypothetical protein
LGAPDFNHYNLNVIPVQYVGVDDEQMVQCDNAKDAKGWM